jgi:pyrroline-5-carboxylate reductase
MQTPTATSNTTAQPLWPLMAFVGGGNMASAIIGGLRRAGVPADRFRVVDTEPEARARLRSEWGVATRPKADAWIAEAQVVVWAVKPQHFHAAAAACAGLLAHAQHLSVMAGVRCATLTQATGSRRIVRAMPNTPALIGQGISGVYAASEINDSERGLAQAILAPTGQIVWLEEEAQLDAVTALSGSGPGYVFYFLEAMVQAGTDMGLSEAQARQLAQATFSGAAQLATQSDKSLAALRTQVTSMGGTTQAALEAMEADGVGAALRRAIRAAEQRARQLASG